MTSAGKSKAAENWLANPAMPYVVAGVGLVVLIFLLPKLIRSIFAGGQQAYDSGKNLVKGVAADVVDTGAATLGQVSSIVGKPSTELPGQQTFGDKLKGLLAGGDSRTWSDLFG